MLGILIVMAGTKSNERQSLHSMRQHSIGYAFSGLPTSHPAPTCVIFCEAMTGPRLPALAVRNNADSSPNLHPGKETTIDDGVMHLDECEGAKWDESTVSNVKAFLPPPLPTW